MNLFLSLFRQEPPLLKTYLPIRQEHWQPFHPFHLALQIIYALIQREVSSDELLDTQLDFLEVLGEPSHDIVGFVELASEVVCDGEVVAELHVLFFYFLFEDCDLQVFDELGIPLTGVKVEDVQPFDVPGLDKVRECNVMSLSADLDGEFLEPALEGIDEYLSQYPSVFEWPVIDVQAFHDFSELLATF